jgi:tRNA (cytidine32/uridine32-2'-O)-methyltransferase
MGEKINVEKHQNKIALVFGRESSGLSNEELQLAHYHVQIPSSEHYGSLNVAQAVQVLCYEIRVAFLSTLVVSSSRDTYCGIQGVYPDTKALADFYQHLETLLIEVEFIDAQKPMHQMQKLRRIFTKSRLEIPEIQLLRGIFTDIQKYVKKLNTSL